MKISKNKLKQIIQEELDAFHGNKPITEGETNGDGWACCCEWRNFVYGPPECVGGWGCKCEGLGPRANVARPRDVRLQESNRLNEIFPSCENNCTGNEGEACSVRVGGSDFNGTWNCAECSCLGPNGGCLYGDCGGMVAPGGIGNIDPIAKVNKNLGA